LPSLLDKWKRRSFYFFARPFPDKSQPNGFFSRALEETSRACREADDFVGSLITLSELIKSHYHHKSSNESKPKKQASKQKKRSRKRREEKRRQEKQEARREEKKVRG